jgi:predicted molibdopterin-dependent oxidoreductase YjgC
MTNSIAEIGQAQAILVIGSNTTEAHPIIGLQVKRAVKKNGAKLIVADPRPIPLTRIADIWLQLKPGTNVALLNGMMKVIINEGLCDLRFIEERTEGYEEFKAVIDLHL